MDALDAASPARATGARDPSPEALGASWQQAQAAAAAAPPAEHGWVYHQSSGELTHDGAHVATGYSGNGADRNNPASQAIAGHGPIPRGDYTVGPQVDSAVTGHNISHLTPLAGTDTHGRSSFEMHGDSRAHPGQASDGCVIMPPAVRHELATSPDHTLHVVQ